MALRRFLLYIAYSRAPSQDVSAARWEAMLKWYDTRLRLQEPFEYEQ